jgi:predicted nucleic acid-binding protein
VILVDTSVWIDHFRKGDERLADLLERAQVVTHPFIIGELALERLPRRDALLADLQDLPQASVADTGEVMLLIQQESLFGIGIGYVDVHLLAAARLTPDTSLWTRDKRLSAVAERLSLASRMAH